MQLIHRPVSARDGFSLVDVCVALFILAIALGALIGSVFFAMRLEQANEETAAASQTMRTMVERINAMPFADVYAAYNADPEDDPDPGVDYLALLTAGIENPLLAMNQQGGPAVKVVFPADEPGGVKPAANDTVLPLTLRLAWEGASGPRSVEMSTFLRRE